MKYNYHIQYAKNAAYVPHVLTSEYTMSIYKQLDSLYLTKLNSCVSLSKILPMRTMQRNTITKPNAHSF